MNDEQVDPLIEIDRDLLDRARAAAAGHPGLEDALERLDALDGADIEQHPAEFDAIHQALRAALTDAGQDPAPTEVPDGVRRDPAPDPP